MRGSCKKAQLLLREDVAVGLRDGILEQRKTRLTHRSSMVTPWASITAAGLAPCYMGWGLLVNKTLPINLSCAFEHLSPHAQRESVCGRNSNRCEQNRRTTHPNLPLCPHLRFDWLCDIRASVCV